MQVIALTNCTSVADQATKQIKAETHVTNSHSSSRSDGAATREHIIEEAGRLIAKYGLAGVKSALIAEKSGTSSASINYHFGSRAKLYEEVISEAKRRIDRLPELSPTSDLGLPASIQLRRTLERLIDISTTKDIWYVQILIRELFQPSSRLQKLFEKEGDAQISRLLEISSQISGIPRTAPDLPYFVLCIVGPCIALLMENTYKNPTIDMKKTTAAALLDFFHSFFLAGLLAAGQNYSSDTQKLDIATITPSTRT